MSLAEIVAQAGYLTLEEAAPQLGISPNGLRQAARRGHLGIEHLARVDWVTQAEVDKYRADRLGRRSPQRMVGDK